MAHATVTIEVDDELKAAFAEAANAQDRTEAQFLRDLMHDAVKAHREKRDHDAWLRSEIEQAVREADDPTAPRIPHEEVVALSLRRRAELAKRLNGDIS